MVNRMVAVKFAGDPRRTSQTEFKPPSTSNTWSMMEALGWRLAYRSLSCIAGGQVCYSVVRFNGKREIQRPLRRYVSLLPYPGAQNETIISN